jgi:ABC-type glycerol-3-phosphate transport system substrate-binding protein
MFKRFLAALLSAMLLLTAVPALAVNEIEGELTVWVRTNQTGPEALYGIWGNEPGDPFYDYIKAQFPNLKINYVINKGWGDIAGAAAAGDAPDIFFWDGNPDMIMPQLMNQGLVENLTPYMENDASFVNNFVPGVLDTMTVDGKVYSLPFDVMPYGIFVNYDVLDNANVDYPELDWTLDDFVAMCDAVTNKSDAANPRIAIARNVIENDYIRFMTMFCAIYGVKGYGINAEGKAYSNLHEDPNAIAALEKYMEIQANDYKYTLSKEERDVAGLDNGVWNIDWKAGISATFPGVSSWALIKDENGEPAFNQVFYPAFNGNNGEAGGAPMETISYAIYAGSDNKDAAWAYLSAMTSEAFRNNAVAVVDGVESNPFVYDEDRNSFGFGLPPFTTEYELNDDFAKLYNGLYASMLNPFTLYAEQRRLLDATIKVANGEMSLVDALAEYDNFVNANNTVVFPE